VVCSLHNAAFSVKTGLPEQGPVLQGLQTFEVQEKDSMLTLKIPKDLLNIKKDVAMVLKTSEENPVVIIGGGPASVSAAESLRQAGFAGPITILSKEGNLPYDRTMLSKLLMTVKEPAISFRSKEFFEKYGIDFRTNTEVLSVDYNTKKVLLSGGQSVNYDKLLIATGGSPRLPSIPGIKLKNVYTLRSLEDTYKIQEGVKSKKHLVIIGAGFIGMEAASAIKSTLKDELSVTIINNHKVPCEAVFGMAIGQALKSLSEKNGVRFISEAKIEKLTENTDHEVKEVHLASGEVIPADIVLYGIGITPNT